MIKRRGGPRKPMSPEEQEAQRQGLIRSIEAFGRKNDVEPEKHEKDIPMSSVIPDDSSAKESYDFIKFTRQTNWAIHCPKEVIDKPELFQKNGEGSRIQEEINDLNKEELKTYFGRLSRLNVFHEFSDFYLASWDYHTVQEPVLPSIDALLKGYTQELACRFLSFVEVSRFRPPPAQVTPRAPNQEDTVPTVDGGFGGHFALFRVTRKSGNGKFFVADACHENLLDEIKAIIIDNKSTLIGCDFDFLEGKLLIHDIIMVTELFLNPENSHWTARSFHVLTRKIERNLEFVVAKHKKAVVVGYGEVMEVETEMLPQNEIFIGDLLVPIEWKKQKCWGHESKENSRKQPKPFLHLHNIRPSTETNRLRSLYRNGSTLDPSEWNTLIDFECSISSAAHRVLMNRRFDTKVYPMGDTEVRGSEICFNTVLDGKLWTKRVKICMGNGAQAVVTKIQTMGNWHRVTARLCQEKRALEFRDTMFQSNHLVGPKCLQAGFFEKLDDGSNGKMIIRTMFMRSREVEEPSKPRDQNARSAEPTPRSLLTIAGNPPLNEFQNEYVQGILNKNLITVADFPFASGKSSSIILAAYLSAKEDCIGQHVILVGSNQSAALLVNLLKNIPGVLEEMKPMRFLLEANRNVIYKNEKTNLDYPVLLIKYLKEVVGVREDGDETYEEPSQPHPELVSHIGYHVIRYLLANSNVTLDKMSKVAQRLYNDNCNNKDLFPRDDVLESFLKFVKPRIIISTTNATVNLFEKLEHIRTIQFDDSQNIPQAMLITACALKPNAVFGMIGDTCKPKLYFDAPLGAFLQDIVNGSYECFKPITSNQVYRGSDVVCKWLSGEFYNNRPLWANGWEPKETLENRRNYVEVVEGGFPESLLLNTLKLLVERWEPNKIGVIFMEGQGNMNPKLRAEILERNINILEPFHFNGPYAKDVLVVFCRKRLLDNQLYDFLTSAKQAVFFVGLPRIVPMLDFIQSTGFRYSSNNFTTDLPALQ